MLRWGCGRNGASSLRAARQPLRTNTPQELPSWAERSLVPAARRVPGSVRPRMGVLAGCLFAAVDGRLSGLTRRYAHSPSVTWFTLERKLLTITGSER